MDEGIIEGPFETKDDADVYRPDFTEPLIREEGGIYESGRYYIGLGKDLEAANFKVSDEIKAEAEAKSYVEVKDEGETLPPIPDTWKRKSLRPEDRKLAEEMLSDTIGVFTNCHEIFLQADESNTGYVMVGDGDVADNRGMKLNPGDTIILNIHDTRGVNLWGSAANQNVRCMIKTRST